MSMDNRLIRCKCDNIRSSPCLAPRCRLILILTLEGLIVSQLKGYLSWVLSTPLSIKLNEVAVNEVVNLVTRFYSGEAP